MSDKNADDREIMARRYETLVFFEIPKKLGKIEQEVTDLKGMVQENKNGLEKVSSRLDKILSRYTVTLGGIILLLVTILLDLLIRGFGVK